MQIIFPPRQDLEEVSNADMAGQGEGKSELHPLGTFTSTYTFGQLVELISKYKSLHHWQADYIHSYKKLRNEKVRGMYYWVVLSLHHLTR